VISPAPFLDEHATTIEAGVDDVWPVLLEALDRAFSRTGSARYARAVGCAEHTASGPRPLAEGSTVPGFRVATAVAGSELALAGRHRFSSYTFVFRLEQLGSGRSRLRAGTRATFPGLTGRVYRLLVIDTGGHAVAVRRLLARIKRQAESRT
jgi:hypothetical protein